jgi:alkanesulfonate monooxygenase SsuD/methylene tetrahydromethanopterin reductase-like flavin-dependent oxidoreductase (luciferase family)
MRFGLFGSAQANDSDLAAGIGQGFHDYIDFNVEAEALGYHSTFLVEHHFTGWSQVSATLGLLTYLAARTRTLRLGTAVMVLPWHNPVLLAEEAATLDVLSGGRLDFGIGKGYRHSEFTGFCIPSEEAEARFEEGLEVILKAWTSEGRFSHHGKFWNFENIVVEPAAVQRPRPVIWMGAGSEPSIRKVAMRGFNLLLDQFASPDLIKHRLEFFQ